MGKARMHARACDGTARHVRLRILAPILEPENDDGGTTFLVTGESLAIWSSLGVATNCQWQRQVLPD